MQRSEDAKRNFVDREMMFQPAKSTFSVLQIYSTWFHIFIFSLNFALASSANWINSLSNIYQNIILLNSNTKWRHNFNNSESCRISHRFVRQLLDIQVIQLHHIYHCWFVRSPTYICIRNVMHIWQFLDHYISVRCMWCTNHSCMAARNHPYTLSDPNNFADTILVHFTDRNVYKNDLKLINRVKSNNK